MVLECVVSFMFEAINVFYLFLYPYWYKYRHYRGLLAAPCNDDMLNRLFLKR